ncbi:hypothetical protein [Mariniluteicoccus flavus]
MNTLRTIALAAGAAALALTGTAAGAVGPDQAPETRLPAGGSFVSPSGNIVCAMNEGGVRCDTLEHDWRTPEPANCAAEWGNIWRLGARGPAEPGCAGDPILPTAEAMKGSGSAWGFDVGAPTVRRPDGKDYVSLAYGYSVRSGDVVCSSSPVGVTCQNADGKSFLVAKEKYELR